MTREFICTETFDRLWKKLGLTDDDLTVLQDTLLENPEAGDVIQPHLEGARKIRFSAKGHGKKGGARVIYVDVVIHEQIYLLLVYPKNELDDLTENGRKEIRKIIKAIKAG